MSDPFAILGLAPQSGDAEIRKRYLELVRENPPDRAPERFAEIRKAYEDVRDPAVRLKARVLPEQPQESVDRLAAELKRRLREAPLSLDDLAALAEVS